MKDTLVTIRQRRYLQLISVAMILICTVLLALKAEAEEVSLLGSGSEWKRHYTLFPPVINEADARAMGIDVNDMAARSQVLEGKVGKDFRTRITNFHPNMVTPFPDKNWMAVEFDDAQWLNEKSSDFRIADSRLHFRDEENYIRAARGTNGYVKELGLICQRGTFIVNDPSRVKKVTFALVYRGGFVAYLNGKEIARGHLPAGKLAMNTPAENYPLEVQLAPAKDKKGEETLIPLSLGREHRKIEQFVDYWSKKERRTEAINVDTSLLVKGVNVLAIELHRSAYDPAFKKAGMRFAAIGMSECHFIAEADNDAVVSSFDQRQGLQVWNKQAWQETKNTDFNNPAMALEPLTITAARNGTFSGQVVVGSLKNIDGLNARCSDLKDSGGAVIAASAVQIRYGSTSPLYPQNQALWKESHLNGQRFDLLLDEAPESIAPRTIEQTKLYASMLGVPQGLKPVATIPVWASVSVPKDASPGIYVGSLTISAKGEDNVIVPIAVRVSEWTVPDVKDYHAPTFLYQSPDTLARYFEVEPWSDKHWAMIESSLKLMGEAGNVGLIFPLQAESCLGNAESMVTWIKQADGSFDYDFSRFDKYLDIALKHHHVDRLMYIAINVWGAENKPVTLTRKRDANGKMQKTFGSSPKTQITVIDKVTGEKSKMLMPEYGTAEAEALWRPLLLKVKQRLEQRDLYSKAVLGVSWDADPHPSHVKMFQNILGDIPWMRESHFDKPAIRHDTEDKTRTTRIAVNSIVWGGAVPDPAKKRLHGWQYDPQHVVLNFNRAGVNALVLLGTPNPWNFRMWMESTLTGGRNGIGRAGVDYFRNGYSKGSGNAGCMFGSYPRSAVAQTGLGNNVTDLLGPGADGPVTTVRFENAKEGIQEAEARIVIEKALLAKKLDETLAKECWDVLDHRTRMMRMWEIAGRNNCQIAGLNWQESNYKLFQLAAKMPK